nr:hypothetical protein [Tanacetum cinerariifolium]
MLIPSYFDNLITFEPIRAAEVLKYDVLIVGYKHVVMNLWFSWNQFMHSTLTSHLKIAFKMLRYLKSCPSLGIHIAKTSGEKILKGVVKTVKVDSANQIANILTKGLDTVQHLELVKRLGPYEFTLFTPSETEAPRLQKEEDLRGDDLKHYEAEIEIMNLILISIPNDIYNSMDAFTTAKAMWQRVEQRLIEDSYDDLFDYLQQFEKLVNASRAKKLEKSHDPLALVAHTGSLSRASSPYYVTHPSFVVNYDDDYQGDTVQNNSNDLLTSAMILLARAITRNFSNPTNNHLRTSSNTINQAIVQGDIVNIQSKNSVNDGRNTRRLYVQEEVIESKNVQNDVGNIERTL